MHSDSPRMLCFSGYALDLQRCAVMRGGRELQLRPKSFDVLRYLAVHAGRLISKEELIRATWPNVFVSDGCLVQCIRDIREALSDDAHEIVKTVPRRGYLFAAELSDQELDKRPPAIGSPSQDLTFCRTQDGVNIAVACVGQGMPLVCIPTWATHVEYDWQSPIRGPLCRFLADRVRLVRYDGRGFGLSDRDITDISFTTFERDLDAVVDALHLHRYAILGISQGAATAIAHAARYPERVSKLILHGGFALGRNKRSSAREAEIARAWIAIMRQGWGDDNSALLRIFSSVFLPGASVEQIKWYANLLRLSTSIENAIMNRYAVDDIDILDLLPKVSAPTVVLHCRHDNAAPFDEGRRIATSIPNAKFVILDSENHVPIPGEPAWSKFIGEVETFLLDV
ncbi:pimeloyl-ACP methyl ester carboxylesterase/DNA-binding winged helix-turn-helix (wHTH) protein [Bradyrhizobium sp. AZCC 1578]|uniref:alpha/beta fold hydrolase n=1 Tax=Bradyrhizobium sp. AZCC 1578 TaxID=3117027 RepID=UPI002FF13894